MTLGGASKVSVGNDKARQNLVEFFGEYNNRQVLTLERKGSVNKALGVLRARTLDDCALFCALFCVAFRKRPITRPRSRSTERHSTPALRQNAGKSLAKPGSDAVTRRVASGGRVASVLRMSMIGPGHAKGIGESVTAQRAATYLVRKRPRTFPEP